MVEFLQFCTKNDSFHIRYWCLYHFSHFEAIGRLFSKWADYHISSEMQKNAKPYYNNIVKRVSIGGVIQGFFNKRVWYFHTSSISKNYLILIKCKDLKAFLTSKNKLGNHTTTTSSKIGYVIQGHYIITNEHGIFEKTSSSFNHSLTLETYKDIKHSLSMLERMW